MRCLLGLGLAACAPYAAGQDPRFQDELDLVVRSSVVQGAGARAYGMAGAFLARADDATAVSWNPAGLSYLRRPELSFVWTEGGVNSTEANASSSLFLENNGRHTQNPDFVALTFPLSLGPFSGSGQASFQRVVSFDTQHTISHFVYDENGQRTDELRTDARSHGGYDVLTLGTGWQFTHGLRLGVALNRWFNGYDQTLDKQRLVGLLLSRQRSELQISGWNAHAGIIWSPVPQLNLGAVVKTPFTAAVKLSRSRKDFTVLRGNLVNSTSSQHEADDLSIQWPAALGLGVSWRPRNALTLSLDYTLTRWSRGYIENFFTLNSPNLPIEETTTYTKLPYPTLNDTAGQHDTQELRGGVEYVVIGRTVKWPLRAGLYTNRQYFNQPGGGPPRFSGVAVGTGVIVGPILVDAAYVYERGSYLAPDGSDSIEVGVHSHRFQISTIYRQGAK